MTMKTLLAPHPTGYISCNVRLLCFSWNLQLSLFFNFALFPIIVESQTNISKELEYPTSKSNTSVNKISKASKFMDL